MLSFHRDRETAEYWSVYRVFGALLTSATVVATSIRIAVAKVGFAAYSGRHRMMAAPKSSIPASELIATRMGAKTEASRSELPAVDSMRDNSATSYEWLRRP